MNKSDFTFLKEDDSYLVLHFGTGAIGRMKRWGRCGWSLFRGINKPAFQNINGRMEDAAEILLEEYRS